MTHFIAIDVETANSNYASICQIGLVEFIDGVAVNHWKTYVNPETRFSSRNTSIHGITQQHVTGAPTFPEALAYITPIIINQKLVYHTHFDRTALHQAAQKYNITLPQCSWIDSAIVARETWRQFRYSGFGLDNLASEFNLSVENRHDAEADADLAGRVFLKALSDSNTTIEKWEKVCASKYRKSEWKKEYARKNQPQSATPAPAYVPPSKNRSPKFGILWVIIWPFYALYKLIKWSLADKDRKKIAIIIYSILIIGMAIICQLLFFDFIIYLIKDQSATFRIFRIVV